MTAYRVIVDREECLSCGEGKLWTVMGPEETCIGESFGEEVDAEETMEALNHAYNKGQEAMRERIALEIIPDHRGRCCTDEAARALAEDIRRTPIE